jgi:formylglycine-generating enzyme required for sulfatase activity
MTVGWLIMSLSLTTSQPCGSVPSDMACIPGGTFTRGSNDGPAREAPEMTIRVDSFWMDITEVTSAAYRACVTAGECRRAGPRYKGFSGKNQPIVGVSWHDAVRYCRWKGKRLPTEAEWEKAARGPQGERYPWGNAKPSCERTVYKAAAVNGCGRGTTWPVKSKPVGRYGLYDMAGNAWEWVADWYSPSYAACGDACSGSNPRGPCDGADTCKGHRTKVVRGGSWWWNWRYVSSSWRRYHRPENKPFHHFGFRCASDVK